MTQSQYRKRWMRQHAQYERIAYSIFITDLRESSNKIPFNFLTEDNYESLIDSSIPLEDITQAYFKVYKEIGVIHGERVGREINLQLKDFSLDTFLSRFDRDLLSWLFNNSSLRIRSVRSTMVKYLQEVMSFGIAQGKDIREIARDLEKLINRRNFYRWQALRIARTETTAAANYAATQSAKVSGVLIEKVWISSHDARTRRPPHSKYNHYSMNGVRVAENERFDVNGDKVLYPGDPKGAEGNVINCRCSVAQVVKRDSNGNIIRTDRFT